MWGEGHIEYKNCTRTNFCDEGRKQRKKKQQPIRTQRDLNEYDYELPIPTSDEIYFYLFSRRSCACTQNLSQFV